MAWIELHQAVRDHRKTQALAECLGMPEPHVVGHLVYVFPPSVPTEAVETTTAEKVKPKLVPSRIPDEFPVTAAMTTFAERLGLPPPLVETETDKFLDHFRAKGERKTDWVAAWRNWMRRIGEFQPAPARSRPMNGARSTVASGVVSRSDGAAQRRIMGRD